MKPSQLMSSQNEHQRISAVYFYPIMFPVIYTILRWQQRAGANNGVSKGKQRSALTDQEHNPRKFATQPRGSDSMKSSLENINKSRRKPLTAAETAEKQ
jgi:hypothetical protein